MAATLNRTYTTSRVSGGGVSGAVAGFVDNNGGSSLNNFWNIETAGQPGGAVGYSTPGTNGGGPFWYMTDLQARFPGMTTSNIKFISVIINGNTFPVPVQVPSYDGFDFNSVWMNNSPSGYPTSRPQTVLIVPNNTSAAYGTGNPGLSYSAYGQLPFQSVNGVGLTLTGTTITASGGSLSDGSSVSFVYLPGSVAITPRAITVQGGSISRVYGDANPFITNSVNVTSGALANGDGISLVNISGGPGAANNTHNGGADADAGYSYAYTTSNAFFTSGSALNYNITYANGSIAVTPRPVSVQLTGSTQKVYDGTTSGAALNAGNFLLSNVYPGAPDYAALSASIAGVSAGVFGSANAGSGINVTATGVGLASSNSALTAQLHADIDHRLRARSAPSRRRRCPAPS